MVAAALLSGLLFYQAARSIPAERASKFVDAGVELLHRGQFPEAAARIVDALAIDPTNAEAHHLLGLIRQQDGRTGPAMDSFRAALRFDPRFAPAQARVCELETAAARARESGYEAALAACRRAMALDARDPEPHLHTGWLLGQQGNHAGAIVEFGAALRLDPGFPGAKSELAMAYADSRDFARAIPLLREVIAAEPGNAKAKFQLGSALAKQENCAAALPYLEGALEAAQKHYLLATCYKKLGRAADSASAFARVKAAREGAEARMQAKYRAAIAHKMAQAGRLDEAIAEYRAALALSGDATLRIDLAVALLGKGEAPAAIELLEGDTSPIARYQVALALSKLGRHDEARQALEGALAANPRFVEAHYQLGVTLAAMGDGGAAEAALARAARLRPDDTAIREAWAAQRRACRCGGPAPAKPPLDPGPALQ